MAFISFGGGDTINKIAGLAGEQYTGIVDNQGRLNDNIVTVGNKVNDTNTQVGTINTNTANTANTVDTINTNTAGLSDQITGLEGGFTNITDNMRIYNDGMNTRFNTVDAANIANAENLVTANSGITGLQSTQDSGFADMGTRFNTVDADNLGIQTAVDNGFSAVDTGQVGLSNQMTTGFDTTQGDISTGFDQARIDNDAGFAGIGETQTANEVLRAAGQGAIQGDISAMSGTADTYADSIMAKQGEMEGVQDNFVSSFDNYVDRYTDDTTLAGEARADAAVAASTYDKNIRAEMGTLSSTQSAGQDRLGNKITSAENTIGENLSSGFTDARANVNTGFADATAQSNVIADANKTEDIKKAKSIAAVAAGMESLDINTRQEFHQLSNAFDDEGALIQSSIDSNGNTLRRSIDDSGNMIIDKFNVSGQAMGQKMFNIDRSIAALKEIPSQGSNAAMGNLPPAVEFWLYVRRRRVLRNNRIINMKIHPVEMSTLGIDLIKKFEGLHRVQEDGTVSSYRCPAGVWTAGWGSTYGVKSGTKWTVQECEERLRDDVKKFEDAVKRRVNVPLTQGQFDSLVSWTYNLGEGNLSSSTLLKKLSKGLYEDVPSEMMKWNKARVNGELQTLAGLTRRRAAEASMFSVDAALPSDINGPEMPQKVSASATKKLTKSKTMAGVGVAGTATMLGELAPQIQALVPYAASMKTLFLIVAIGGIALAAYARMKDHKEGIH